MKTRQMFAVAACHLSMIATLSMFLVTVAIISKTRLKAKFTCTWFSN